MERSGAQAGVLIFVWENFGPLHVDRCEAVATAFPGMRVLGLELFDRSTTYDWVSESGALFEKVRLGADGSSWLSQARRLLAAIFRVKPRCVFFCHYERPAIFIAAMVCRLMGIAPYAMLDSKFDDYPRRLWREVLKAVFFLPYSGALTGSRRAADYARFHGVAAARIELGYDAISVARIRKLAGSAPAPGGQGFGSRHFTVVARLVPKKNIALVFQAMKLLEDGGRLTRDLVICGSGPLEDELKAAALALGVLHRVQFRGFVQTAGVAQVLAASLALILPSVEEQFGQVIAEALAMGVPVICSDNCGARDQLVRTGVNGFVIEPDNAAGLAYFMHRLSSDEALWTAMALASEPFARQADVAEFAKGVARLVDRSGATELSAAPS